MLDLLKRAKNPDLGIDRVDLDPGDEVLDSQLHYVLGMLREALRIRLQWWIMVKGFIFGVA
eukprot:4244831-Amphidinium_carterae.1